MNSNVSAVLAELNQEILGNAQLKAALELARRNEACFVPGSGNAGDGLIHLGAFALLNDMNWSPRIASERGLADEPDRGWALLIGGAMIEGVRDERMRALRAFLDRGGHAIILPCTMFGFGELLSKYADQLVIFARERKTLENLRAAGVEHASLCHDLAFAVSPDFYSGLSKDEREGELLAYRTDEERAKAEIPFGNLDLSLLWTGDIWRDAAKVEDRCRLLGGMISTYAKVSTDRLHLGIFAAALGRQARLSGSRGDKIPGVFEYSLRRFANVEFHDVAADAPPAEAGRPRHLEEVIMLRDQAARRSQEEIQQRVEEVQRLEANALAAAQRAADLRAQVENLRRQVATHQRQSLFYARELAATTAELGRVKEVSDALWREKETWFVPREAQLVAEVQRLHDELHRPPVVNSSGFLQSLSRSFRMISYVLFPFGKRRKNKRRKMLAALWKPK
ncbi:hypothetical protein M2323_002588 [Rhodoblastus acidophilus]|uniref:polysaccharide pyruvyl transferase family protein n=1 Tax=Rhodoblastus acidophilus TaxID=1074 RepID=UPI00222587E9|nr:polysaccharide pyruvyl transferase family protein [Rhodoblastus acidophilus]MCW2284701.1 hypothetical protein [Rhodoblastus acidophilus]MCW2333654.1 hypothetical protein [Rhodoblastus acidophilus]